MSLHDPSRFPKAGRDQAIWTESADSVGRAMLRAGDGTTLRCEFNYAGMSHAGFGSCISNSGKQYDPQITL